MKLLVTTSQGGLLYDPETRRKTPVERGAEGSTDCFGVTWTRQGRLYIAWRFPAQILEYDEKLAPTGRRLISPHGESFDKQKLNCAPHQLLCIGNFILVADTGWNEVTVFDADTLQCVSRWCPHVDTQPDGARSECRHYNSLYYEPGVLWTVAHMHTQQESRVWCVSYDEERGQVGGLLATVDCGWGAHNIFRLGGKLAICDSMRHRVRYIGGEQTTIYQEPSSAVLRGVCLPEPEQLAVVGGSQLTVQRECRWSGGGWLLIWRNPGMRGDPEMHELGPGPVQDVRCLDSPDAAHSPVAPFW